MGMITSSSSTCWLTENNPEGLMLTDSIDAAGLASEKFLSLAGKYSTAEVRKAGFIPIL